MDAGPRDLIQRIYFQLIGHPSTPEQVETFLGDRQLDALARVVDQALGFVPFRRAVGPPLVGSGAIAIGSSRR